MATELDLTKEEFLVLRSEADAHVAETRRLEIAAIGGAAAIYAWLATHQPIYGIGRWTWLLPVLLPIFGGLRSYALYRRIHDIGTYLKKMDVQSPETQRLGQGWENFLASRSRYLAKSAWAFWFALLLICAVLSVGVVSRGQLGAKGVEPDGREFAFQKKGVCSGLGRQRLALDSREREEGIDHLVRAEWCYSPSLNTCVYFSSTDVVVTPRQMLVSW